MTLWYLYRKEKICQCHVARTGSRDLENRGEFNKILALVSILDNLFMFLSRIFMLLTGETVEPSEKKKV